VERTKQGVQQAKKFGQRVRKAREAHRDAAGRLLMSQEDLADAAGLHRTYIGHVERGEVNLTLWSIVRIAAALRVDPADLVRGLKP
jgi:transcriptional regulator with XRE-family HTH domain